MNRHGDSIRRADFGRVADKIKKELTGVGNLEPYFNFICGHFRLSKDDICGKSRKGHIIRAKHLLVCLLNEFEPRMPLYKITESVNLHHAGAYNIFDKLEYQKGFKNEYEVLRSAFIETKPKP